MRILREVADLPDEALRERGERAQQALAGDLSQAALVGRLFDLLERDVVSGGRS